MQGKFKLSNGITLKIFLIKSITQISKYIYKTNIIKQINNINNVFGRFLMKMQGTVSSDCQMVQPLKKNLQYNWTELLELN